MSDINFKFLLEQSQPRPLFEQYLDHVANTGLLAYKAKTQWGNKQGQSLYTHVLDGIFVLETLREPLELEDLEAKILYTAYTVHDINKVTSGDESFKKAATPENIAHELQQRNLPAFFPDWETYLNDITVLVQAHAGHYPLSGGLMVQTQADQYQLSLSHLRSLVELVRAVDIIDLSHTLSERKHKTTFLSHLNTYLADSGLPRQYRLITHQLTEMRGILTNVIHNAIRDHLHDDHTALPLLYYPDGVAYLVEKGQAIAIQPSDTRQMGARVAADVSRMVSTKFREFISPRPAGIKVDAKCLELGVAFDDIFNEINTIIQKRTPDVADLDAKARDWAQRGFEKAEAEYPAAAEQVQAAIADEAVIVGETAEQLRLAELVRSYYIFLNDHFSDSIEDSWEYIYKLLDLPEAQHGYYAYFNALYARAYVLVQDISLTYDQVYQRIVEDGTRLTEGDAIEDPKAALFSQYLDMYALFSTEPQPTLAFGEHLAHYVDNQHKQCVYCSGPFPTDKWMSADVRSDITVQTFSNRLRGGPGEPKKYICAVCQIQFLLEKLDYPEVRHEKTLYLHLFPYSFLTEPFINGLRGTIKRIIRAEPNVNALNMNAAEALRTYLDRDQVVNPTFRSRTKKDKPQPYGLYLPRYAEQTVGNLLIFPINPAGSNDTEKFLFALWYALLLQRHFGVKALMSSSPVPPLGQENIPDIYLDNIPLGCRGLLTQNDYAEYTNGDQAGELPALRAAIGHLFALRTITFAKDDTTPRLVRALNNGPLAIFYETERLIEAKLRGEESGGLLTYLVKQAFEHVTKLAQNKGGTFMAELHQHLQQLAKIAWENRLIGRSLNRSSLLFPINEIFQKLGHPGGVADRETIKAAAKQEIFDHLDRLADRQYRPGRKKHEAINQFVDGWFDDVLAGVYKDNLRKFLTDEKLLRSAYHFYIREQIPSKGKDNATNGDTSEEE